MRCGVILIVRVFIITSINLLQQHQHLPHLHLALADAMVPVVGGVQGGASRRLSPNQGDANEFLGGRPMTAHAG